ncbi:zinc ribbon domain-containing protein [Wolbachia pipientis]
MCNSKSIRVDILEEAVWKEMKMVLKEPEAILLLPTNINGHKNKVLQH